MNLGLADSLVGTGIVLLSASNDAEVWSGDCENYLLRGLSN